MKMKKKLIFVLVSLFSLSNVFGQGEVENPNPELLRNEFFYDVTGNVPNNWTVSGATSEVFNSGPVFRNSGYALRLRTADTPGYVEQIVNIEESQIAVGSDVEGLIHYSVDETSNEQGALRLMMQWLDEANNVITSEEDKKFVDNESLLFSKFKAWGTLYFRATRPANAKKFRFAIYVAPNSNVRLDDFSLKKPGSNGGFMSVLPQELRTFHANVDASHSQKAFVQIRNFVNDGTVTMPLNQPFTADKTTFDNTNGTKEVIFTFTPTEPTKIPRGYSAPPSVTIGLSGTATQKLQLKAMAIDPNNPPTITFEPVAFQPIKVAMGDVPVTREVLVKVKNAIDKVDIKVEPAGKGFAISSSSLYYFTRPTGNNKVGVNDTNIKITFTPKEVGTIEGKLIFTTDMMEPVEYPISANVVETENIEEKFSKEKPVTDKRYPAWADGEYHFMDTGLWHWPKEKAAYGGAEDPTLSLARNGTALTYVGKFSPGMIYNQSFPNGIKQVTVHSAYNGPKCKLGLDVSYDGGGTWTRVDTKVAVGAVITNFVIDSHKNTLFRIVLVNDEGVQPADGFAIIEKVKVVANTEENRETVASERELANFSGRATNARLFTEFNDIPHHLNLAVDGWSNFSINANRSFVAFDEHESDVNSPLVESCAKVSLYNAKKYKADQPMTAVLISPMLSYTDAASKKLGFRLKRTIPTEGDKFSIYIVKLKNGIIENESDMLEVPYESMLPGEKMSDGFWYDYLLDLEKYEIPNIENFAVMFVLKSPNDPQNTTSSYFIDDFAWGRTDNPSLTVDKKELKFYNMSNFESEGQKISVTTENAIAPIALKLFGNETSFLLYNKEMNSITAMPKEGGDLIVTVKTKATKDQNSILYMATRNGAPVYVTLFATAKSKDADNNGGDNGGNNGGNNGGSNVDSDGYDTGDDIINGKTSVDEINKYDSYAYKTDNSIVVVSNDIKSVTVYDLNGVAVKQSIQGGDKVCIDNVNAKGTLVLKIVYNNGNVKTLKVM